MRRRQSFPSRILWFVVLERRSLLLVRCYKIITIICFTRLWKNPKWHRTFGLNLCLHNWRPPSMTSFRVLSQPCETWLHFILILAQKAILIELSFFKIYFSDFFFLICLPPGSNTTIMFALNPLIYLRRYSCRSEVDNWCIH